VILKKNSTYSTLSTLMRHGGLVLLDGGIGTELERRGVPMNPQAWCGLAAQEHAAILDEIHSDYIRAGAEIITANTYASSRLMLSNAGMGNRVIDINSDAIKIASMAREKMNRDDVAIAGSLSHMVPMLHGQDEADPAKKPSNALISEALHEQAEIFAKEACDLILLEMMYSPESMTIALDAAVGSGLPVWAGLSARSDSSGNLLSYDKSSEIEFQTIVKICINYGVDAIGIMHTRPDLISPCIQEIRRIWSGLIYCYPDSGYFKMPNWRFEEIISPTEFCELASHWVDAGASAIGGCCGLSPKHIRNLAALKDTHHQSNS